MIPQTNGQKTNNYLKFLPNSISKLELSFSFCSIDNDTLKSIPFHIENLKLNYYPINDEGLKSLHSNLKKLKLTNISQLNDQSLKFLPSALEKLNISGTNNLVNHIGMPYLPTGLKTLKLQYNEDPNQVVFNSIPSFITNLSIICEKQPIFPPLLPLNVRKLYLSLKDVQLETFPNVPLQSLTCDSVDILDLNLPDTIQNLTFSWCKFSHNVSLKFPSSLTHLSFENCSDFNDTTLILFIPSLEFLNIKKCKLITLAGVKTYQTRNGKLKILKIDAENHSFLLVK